MSDVLRENLAIARRLWRGASDGDPHAMLDFDPKIVWRTYGTGPNAGLYHGMEAVLGYLASVAERSDQLRSELIDVLASENGAIIHYRTVFERGSKTLDTQYFLWLRIEDGVVVEAAAVPFDQAAADAFWKPH